MLGVKPRSFSRMVMDYSQMEEVLTIAIQQLKEKIRMIICVMI